MSLAGTLMTPRIDSKIRKKMLASKYKHKRADFKDILRERFKNRIRDNRRSLFEKMRSLDCSETVQNTLSVFLRDEIKDFDKLDHRCLSNWSADRESDMDVCEPEFDYDQELEIMRTIETELLEEEFNWIIEEYRKEEEEISSMMTESRILCPVCQRGTLQKHPGENSITCTTCSLHLFTSVSLEQLGITLRLYSNEHSKNCIMNPQFDVINDFSSNSLVIICDHCSFLAVLN